MKLFALAAALLPACLATVSANSIAVPEQGQPTESGTLVGPSWAKPGPKTCSTSVSGGRA
jgi:hypothetical protein